ncbi:hypothetical protein BS47DRAFT_1395287 [Hydnum rufescens UP504]|uniref:Uncharacterized protein n=1 Tax=Hydnum rufescens UP504 TaxID=1448309 RepID=A0A9P6DU53_9AGAM|nr:hypothetical protein BS47DRAFT_1395287 [Hydnum rufescens UP504]
MEVQEVWDMIPPHNHISLDFFPDVVEGDDLWVSKWQPDQIDICFRLVCGFDGSVALTPTASELQAQPTGVIPGADILAYASEAVAKAKEDILGIVEALDSQLQLGGPDCAWHACEGLGDLYKEKAHSNYDAWKLGLDALDPVAWTSKESKLLTWHEQNILETEVVSVQLPGGCTKKMEKIKLDMGEQVCFHITILREIDDNEFFG